MDDKQLSVALRRLRVGIGSLACLGCGHEQKCSIHGCAIIRAAEKRLAELTADAVSIVRCKDCKHLCDMQTCYICSVTVSCIKDMDGFCSRGERKV